MTSARDGLAAIAVWLDDAADTDGCMPAEFLFWDKTPDFMDENLHLHTARPLWGVFPMPDLMNPAPGLPHDDFRRTHDDFRGMHHNYRRYHSGFVMMFVSRVPAPIASREDTASGGEKGDDAGQIQDFFHIR